MTPHEPEIGARPHDAMIFPAANRCQEIGMRRAAVPPLTSAYATEKILSPFSSVMLVARQGKEQAMAVPSEEPKITSGSAECSTLNRGHCLTHHGRLPLPGIPPRRDPPQTGEAKVKGHDERFLGRGHLQ
jgi:hypothetical protein